jgi:cytochrome P450
MSATSFGGSFNLLETNDTWLKEMFNQKLKRAAVDGTFPFLKHVPFMPPSIAIEMNKMIDGIIHKRRKENSELKNEGTSKKDLVQIFVDTNEADPISFSEAHIREEMFLFMYVFKN